MIDKRFASRLRQPQPQCQRALTDFHNAAARATRLPALTIESTLGEPR